MKLPLKKNTKNDSGQALIIILLAMSVALTLVLSSVSRSLTDIEITDKEEESLRAFSAAEAGVEEALLKFSQGELYEGGEGTLDGQTTTEFDVDVSTGKLGKVLRHPKELDTGESVTYMLVGRSSDGALTCEGDVCSSTTHLNLCFGNKELYTGPGPYPTKPAIEVQIFYDDSATGELPPLAVRSPNDYSNVKVLTRAYDSDSSRVGSNNFNLANASCDTYDPGMYVKVNPLINLISQTSCSSNRVCVLAVTFKSLYSEEPVPVLLRANDFVPAQGIVISSTGTSGESSRRLDVHYDFSTIPSIFNNTVFSSGALIK